MGYLARAGRDWPDAPRALELLSDRSLRAFLLGPDQLGDPGFAPVLAQLERTQRELLRGRAARGHRLFARGELSCAAAP
jgi:hypothetical protein